MKEREKVQVIFQDGSDLLDQDAEVTRDGGVLTIRSEGGVVTQVNWDFIAYYSVGPVEVKNLDD
jgi:hypothetical protein